MANDKEFYTPENSSNEDQSQELDRIIHEPSRMRIMAALNSIEEADFKYLETISKLQKSNLSIQTAKLEQAGYITIRKYIKGKFASTSYSITPVGKAAFATYMERMKAVWESEQYQSAKLKQGAQEGDSINQGSPTPQPGIP